MGPPAGALSRARAALESGDGEEARRALEAEALEALARGEDVAGSLEVLAESHPAAVAASPLLLRLRLALDERVEPGRTVAELERAPLTEADPAGGTGVVACLDAWLRAREALRRGDRDGLARHAAGARDALPAGEPWLAVQVASILHAAYRFLCRPDLAAEAARIALAVADRTDLPATAVRARNVVGGVRILEGRFAEADQAFVAAAELAAASGAPGGPSPSTLQFRGYVAFQGNDLERAETLLRQAAERGEAEGVRGVATGAHRVRALALAALGRADEARSAMARLEGHLREPLSLRNREWLGATRAAFDLAVGDVGRAAEWPRRQGYRPAEVAASADGWLAGRLHEAATLADVLLATGRERAAAPVARRVRDVAAAGGRRWFAVRCGVQLAEALHRLGRKEEAAAEIDRALGTGVEEGYVRAFALPGGGAPGVLRRAAGVRGAGSAAARLVRALGSGGVARRPDLTPREAEALGLLRGGLSNKAIAREMGVAPATVKTHLHHLYRKLDVGSRTEALARAEALGLG